MLATKHDSSKAFFVEECKLGEQGSRRLDAWVLLKTWSPLTAIGYEVKVDRSDFLNDRKWEDYLPACHEFNFVCPAKLIDPAELPKGVGLLWTNGTRLVTKRKAARSKPDPETMVRLMAYALMSRARPVASWGEANALSRLEYWRAWLAVKEESQHLGHEVSKRIRRLVDAEREKRRKAENEMYRFQRVEARLEALGLPAGATEWDVTQKAREATQRPERLLRIERLANQLLDLARQTE
jgi:hypothetical protein